jgi:protein-tyrosine-phosphatase
MITRKKKAKKKAKFLDEAFTGSEPVWTDSDKWTAECYYRERSRISYYYGYYYKTKDFISWVVDWMSANEYSKEDIKSYKAAPDWRTRSSLGGSVRALSRGMPENHKDIPEFFKTMEGIMNPEKGLRDVTEEVRNDIDNIIEMGKKIKKEKTEEEKVKVKKYKPSIQELLERKSLEMSWDIDDFVYDFDGSKEMLADFNPQKILLIAGAKPNHAKVVSKLYEPLFNEFDELLNPPNVKKMSEYERDMHNQLKEGYSHMSKSDIKNHYNMFKMIGDACDNIVLKGKITRKPRKKKIISKEKQISKFKYLDHHPETKSISVNPTELIGANAAIVYNSKTRKLGIYHASNIDPKGLQREGTGLSVKGTTIQGFDPSTSTQKTLRKPLQQLATFKKVAKRSLNKEFDAITTVEVKMNGRFNDHSLIIKVF